MSPTKEEPNHMTYLEEFLFGVIVGKLWGFYLTKKGIDAHLVNWREVVEIPSRTSKKDIQRLNGMLAALSHLIANLAQHALLF